MKGLLYGLLAPAVAHAALYSAEQYANGEVHQMVMDAKIASWDRQIASGEMDSSQYPSSKNKVTKCVNGVAAVEPGNAAQTFKCKDMDFLDFKSHADLGSITGQGSSSWGWVGPGGREFAAIGQGDGTAFAEISKSGELIYLGRLPQQSVPSQWREIRSYKNYMIIGSEAVGHGIQIFDMRKLLNIDPKSPKLFSTVTDLTGLFTDLPIGRTHNVVVNEELGYAASVGAAPRNSTCAAGIIFMDLSDITKPTSPGCANQDGYVHDAECLRYRGPDKRYFGKDICYGYNENSLTIYEVGNKKGLGAGRIISNTSYPGASYTHQGAVLDKNWQTHLILDDELDEEKAAGPAADGIPVTYIFDITDLEKPRLTGSYKAAVKGIDHNQYVFNGLAYQSNYGAGIRVYDVSSIPRVPSGKDVKEVAYFDIYPEDDNLPGGGIVDFVGTWSHYAGYPSGNILVNTIERGAFVVKMNKFKKMARGEHYKKPRNINLPSVEE